MAVLCALIGRLLARCSVTLEKLSASAPGSTAVGTAWARPVRAARRVLPGLSLAMVFALAAGCATPVRVGPPVPPPRATDQSAYRPAEKHTTAALQESWQLRGEALEATLLAPVARGAWPLVVYLPGLGEASAAGLGWRRAWAEAGYAVLSVQPVANAGGVWSAERARAFDFRAVAQEHFSPRDFSRRLARLQAVLDEAGRRQRLGGDDPYARIDLTRVAVAGYDLGAETAMVVAGQTAPDGAPGPAPAAVRTVIALSPYADFAGMGVAERFRDIRLPVLSVTSPDDTDAYGLVTTAAVRRAPFEHMPPGSKYLLLLAAAPHSLLGGREEPGADADDGLGGARSGGDQDRGSRRRPDSGAAGGDSRTGRDGRMARGGAQGGSGDVGGALTARPNLAGLWATQLRNVQLVTTAYLDATLKGDAVALEWLARDANRWLGGTANLFAK